MSRDVVGELRGLMAKADAGDVGALMPLSQAMHRHLPALLAIATGAMHAADRSHTNGDGTCAVPWECIEEIRQGFAALSHLATATTKEGKK